MGFGTDPAGFDVEHPASSRTRWLAWAGRVPAGVPSWRPAPEASVVAQGARSGFADVAQTGRMPASGRSVRP